jgi:hypothetical protein
MEFPDFFVKIFRQLFESLPLAEAHLKTALLNPLPNAKALLKTAMLKSSSIQPNWVNHDYYG